MPKVETGVQMDGLLESMFTRMWESQKPEFKDLDPFQEKIEKAAIQSLLKQSNKMAMKQ